MSANAPPLCRNRCGRTVRQGYETCCEACGCGGNRHALTCDQRHILHLETEERLLLSTISIVQPHRNPNSSLSWQDWQDMPLCICHECYWDMATNMSGGHPPLTADAPEEYCCGLCENADEDDLFRCSCGRRARRACICRCYCISPPRKLCGACEPDHRCPTPAPSGDAQVSATAPHATRPSSTSGDCTNGVERGSGS